MTTILDILKNTYMLTFDQATNYDWSNIVEVFINSDDVAEDLISNGLINQSETEKKIIYWQDLFFMEIAECEKEIEIDNGLLEKIKSHELYKTNRKFIDQLPKATTVFGRELLIDTLIENEDADILIPDDIVENALKKKSRDDLRKSFEKWNDEENDKIPFNYKKIFYIAAIVLLGVFIWQPNKFTDDKLISEFAYNETVIKNINDVEFQNNAISKGLRGEEFIFEGYTQMESEMAIKAISLLNQNETAQAKAIFKTLKVEDKGNNQLLFFLAISEAYSNEEHNALKRFINLSKIENFEFTEDSEFQSAMMLIKTNQRKKGKKLLNSIIEKKGKYETISKDILSKMRWF